MKRVYSLYELQERCKIWQDLLNLSDWQIKTDLVPHSEFGECEFGTIEHLLHFKHAKIKLPTAETYEYDFDPDYDMIPILVHELLHLVLDQMLPPKSETDQGFKSSIEIAINKLAGAFAVMYDDLLVPIPKYTGCERIMDISELKKTAEEWLFLLNMSDWQIDVVFVPQMGLDNKFGEVDFTRLHRKALVKMVEPETYACAIYPKQDMLFALLHELMHIVLANIFPRDKATSLFYFGEEAINAIVRGFIRLNDAKIKETTDAG